MKNRKCFFVFFLIFIASTSINFAKEISYPDFISSMLREKPNQDVNDAAFINRKRLYDLRSAKFKNMFKEIYENNSKAAKEDLNQTVKIPKIIHQIWLGKAAIPKACQHWMKTWSNLKGWTYKLWTDQEASRLTMHNRDLYEAAENYGEKSDILRLEILKKFGGLYVDVDYECLNPGMFEELHQDYDFYIGFEPLEHGSIGKFNMFKVCNAIMASCPDHPLIKDILINLKPNFFAYKSVAGCVERTGPSYLTRMICAYEKSEAASKIHRNIYLPSTFFYAYSEPEMRDYFTTGNTSIEPFLETAGHHYWSGTWRVNETEEETSSFAYYISEE